jgi:hypothetical protein
MKLTIEQIKEKRTHLAANISEAVNRFQRETGCTVERIEFQHLMTADSSVPVNSQVTVKIAID